MNQNDPLRQNSNNFQDQEDNNQSIIALYQSIRSDNINHQEKLNKIYAPIDYPICGYYSQPELAPIRQRKIQLGKKYMDAGGRDEDRQDSYDGLYSFTSSVDKNADLLLRKKIRMVRDIREEYFQQNGELIMEKQLISDELSKLANISLEENTSLQTFQKNAILSQRNNQKKQTPFQLQLYILAIHFTNHPLHSQEERKFEQLRPLLKEWAEATINPYLPEIAKELRYLQRLKEMQEGSQQLEKKIQIVIKQYNKQKSYLQKLINEIIQCNEELKQIRRKKNIETVPWKVHIKEFNIDDKRSYDVGVTACEINQKIVGGNPSQVSSEEKRRNQIKSQYYFVKIFANGNLIGTSEKAKLQWPLFKVDINQKFNILVYTAPATIKVEIIKSGIFNTIIDVIYLPVPGINAKSITSTEPRYNSSLFYYNRHLIAHQKKQGLSTQPKQDPPTGILLHKLQWKGQGKKMPTIASKTAQEDTACTTEASLQDSSAYEELFDGLDPRIQHNKIKERVDNQIRKGGNALLPFIDIQSARHLLLKMKTTRPDLQKIQIPLTEEEIRNRQDLQQIIQEQYKHIQDIKYSDKKYLNPAQGKFSEQSQAVLDIIKQIIGRINLLKGLASGATIGNTRYKITQQIVSQYIFQQMESPIVIFFKNLFTQKRKLGPQAKINNQAKSKIDELQINLHVRSARNLPIRESSFERIRQFQEEQNKFKQQNMMMQYNNNAPMMNRFDGYGQGFFRQQPNINMHGNTFFNAFQNQGNHSQEIRYNNHIDLDRVNAQVQLRYKKNVKRTRCFQGPYPQWNETLFFNFSMRQEETNIQKIMMSCQNYINVFIFDMVEQSKATQAISEARVKKYKYYLGRIDIPLAFLIAVPSVSGLFKLARPLIQFGYGIKRSGLFDPQNQQQQNKTQNPDIHTYINLDLFCQPSIDNMIAYNSDRKFIHGIGQNPLVLQRASDWLEQLNTKRYIRLWLNNLDGKSIFICRYLSDNICPPNLSGEGNGSWIERTARFVSLISAKQACKFLQNTEEFHMKCNEFLSIKMGEDHGILLCNYFNYIDKAEGNRDMESLLVICKAFPYGKAIFVLRRHKITKNCQIWDPFKGQCFYFSAKQYETFCCFLKYKKLTDNIANRDKDISPILQISCLVSRQNVYFNIQQEIKPQNIDFNIQDEKLWKPFVTERTKNQLFEKGTIQTIQNTINPDFYHDGAKLQSAIQIQLKQMIRNNLEKDRISHFKPYTFKINDRITNIIYNRILPLCETFKVDFRVTGSQSQFYSQRSRAQYEEAVGKIQEEKDKIKAQIAHDKNLFGFSLNMSYTTGQEVLQRIKETQIHLEQTNDIEFILAVRVFQYPCFVFSVWVFIGTIS